MAHMWFGDLVTMRWWDDLWLNEAFASWAATWAAVSATTFTDGWATFLAGLKLTGYQSDMGPATHPIRDAVPDVAHAMANFDAITYVKGQSVLRQLVAYVGEDAFVAGLAAYFRDHAWGNTTLADLMSAVGGAAGRDLTSWTEAWFDRAGTDTLTLAVDPGAPGGEILAAGPDDAGPRPHRLDIASYRRAADALEPLGVTEVETSGPRTPVPDLPAADLHLVNHGDLTFTAARPDARSTETLLGSAGLLPDPLSRALAVTTAWDMVVKGELAVDDFLTCVLDVLAVERSAGVVEPFLALALKAAEQWSPPEAAPGRLARLADVAAALADVPDHRTPALRTLAASASTDEQWAMLARAAEDNHELAWRVLTRRAALGQYDEAAVEALAERDPDPESAVRALGVRAARPDDDAKEEAWVEAFGKRSIPGSLTLIQFAAAFWRPPQGELTVRWAHRYLDELEHLPEGGMLAIGGLVRNMFPTAGDQAFVDRARAIATAEGTDPVIRTTLLTGADTISRILRAQGAGVSPLVR
jgi:aminopeptidase N